MMSAQARRKLSLSLIAPFIAGSVLAAAEMSAFSSVIVNPEATPLWTTVTGGTVTVPVSYPAGAKSASLTVTAFGYEKTYSDVSEGDFELAIPATAKADDERIYTLTLAFDDGTSTVAKLACVAGDGDTCETVLTDDTSDDWKKIHRTSLVPMDEGASALTANGEECDSTPYAGWAFVGRNAAGSKITLASLIDGVSKSIDLETIATMGLILIIR